MKKVIIISLLMIEFVFSLEMTVYKSKYCGCCSKWVESIKKQSDIKVKTINTDNLDFYKKKYNIATKYQGCHTAIIKGYVLEGHVPMSAINRLLKEQPKNIYALSVPGMPIGSMGMEQGKHKDKYNVIALRKNGKHFIYEKH